MAGRSACIRLDDRRLARNKPLCHRGHNTLLVGRENSRHKACKLRVFLNRLWKRYKLLPREYTRLIEKSEGRCDMCGDLFKSSWDIKVDHNHVTKKVRGLLCNTCNGGLGYVEDKAFCKNATFYLLKHKEH